MNIVYFYIITKNLIHDLNNNEVINYFSMLSFLGLLQVQMPTLLLPLLQLLQQVLLPLLVPFLFLITFAADVEDEDEESHTYGEYSFGIGHHSIEGLRYHIQDTDELLRLLGC